MRPAITTTLLFEKRKAPSPKHEGEIHCFCCRHIGLALVVAALLCQCTSGQTSEIREPAIVVDGDTLLIKEVSIRLAGIDAPELGQSCTSPTKVEWDCGQATKRALSDKVGREPVSCSQLYLDAYGRLFATCTASNGDNLSAAMVDAGYALAVGSAKLYVAEETAARLAVKGIWSGSFQTPWEWRAQQRDVEDE